MKAEEHANEVFCDYILAKWLKKQNDETNSKKKEQFPRSFSSAFVAEYERSMIIERTQNGKAIAKQNPNYKEGRPKKYTTIQLDHALSLLKQGHSYKEVVAITGISKPTLLRAKR